MLENGNYQQIEASDGLSSINSPISSAPSSIAQQTKEKSNLNKKQNQKQANKTSNKQSNNVQSQSSSTNGSQEYHPVDNSITTFQTDNSGSFIEADLGREQIVRHLLDYENESSPTTFTDMTNTDVFIEKINTLSIKVHQQKCLLKAKDAEIKRLLSTTIGKICDVTQTFYCLFLFRNACRPSNA